MTVRTLTLSDFLLARIAEDEQAANDALTDRIANWNEQDWIEIDDTSLTHVRRHDPARALAECEAKRRIVEGVVPERDPYFGHPDYDAEWMLKLLALPYADHEDYDPEWRP